MADGTIETNAGGQHVTITRHIAQQTPGRVTYEVRVGGVACTGHRTLREAREAAALALATSSAAAYVEAQVEAAIRDAAQEVAGICPQCGGFSHGNSHTEAERGFSAAQGEVMADGTAPVSREAQLEAALMVAMRALAACQTALDLGSPWRATQDARAAIGEAVKAADPFLVDDLDAVIGGAR